MVLDLDEGFWSHNRFYSCMEACRSVEVAGRTFDRKVGGSSPDINIIGCRQEGHPDIKWLTAPSKVLQCGHRPTPNTGESGRKT